MAYSYCRSLTFHAWQCPFKPATITEKPGYAIEQLERLSTRQLLALGLSTGFYANEKVIRTEFWWRFVRKHGGGLLRALVGPKQELPGQQFQEPLHKFCANNFVVDN